MESSDIESLYKSFPLAFDQSSGRLIRIDCEAGWLPILKTLCALMHERNGRDGVISVWISRVVEKFGSLRVLTSGSSGEVREWIDSAHSESMHTCELCGASGKLTAIDGWQRTRCETHFGQYAVRDGEDTKAAGKTP